MKKFFTVVFILGMLCTAFAQENHVLKYRNVLNIRNIPADSKDLTSFAFCDLGSWFGFALPAEDAKEYRGNFAGPYLVSEGCWLGKSLVKFSMKDTKTGRDIDLSEGKLVEISYYPGCLTQKYLIDNIYLELYLIFISNRTAVVTAQLSSIDDSPSAVEIKWSGNVFENVAKISKSANEITIKPEKTTRQLFVHWGSQAVKKAETVNNTYSVEYENNFLIEKNKYTSAYLFVSQAQNEAERKKEQVLADEFLGYPKKFFDFNRNRWNGYLSKITKTDEDFGDDFDYRRAAVKCLLTLINNWKSPMGSLKHDGIVPSYSHNYFTGFWAWDSWKHASALAYFEPELAKNQMRAMFDFQNSKGMIPDCVFIDSTQNNWLDTKPPLAAWAVWNIYEATKDKAFLREFYPKLVKYHKWWYLERDHDKNGLCEYGATKDTLEAALWESGMDNAIRFDGAKMLKNNNEAFSLNQESVDLNSYLCAEKVYLAKMAEVLGFNDEANAYMTDSGLLKGKIQDNFFDKKSGYFFDISIDRKKYIPVYGPEGWIPLWALAASQVQAEAVQKIIFDSDKFKTRVPFPTVSADNPKLDVKGYWRGPVWLDQAYFGIVGLKNYGFINDAGRLTERIFDRLDGYIKSDKPIRENYNPFTGEGLKANHFSWSAAHLLLLWLGK